LIARAERPDAGLLGYVCVEHSERRNIGPCHVPPARWQTEWQKSALHTRKETEMIMPFGKFKGHDLESLPSSYLKWLAENINEDIPKNKAICMAADKEYLFREKNSCHIE